MRSKATLHRSKTVYDGRILRVKLDDVSEPGGVTATREVVEHAGSVVVLPFLPDGRTILVRQYRHPARQYLWELVAGSIERGENVIKAARRELLEEAGYQARTLKQTVAFYSSPGFLTECMYLIEARGLKFLKAQPEDDERIQVKAFSQTQIDRLLREKKIKDGKTLVGLLWAKLTATRKKA